MTSIGYAAFMGCTSLTSITIPNSVTSIGRGAFYGCTGLTSITIPNSVTSIGSEAFNSCSSLTSVTFGNSVTSIGDRAFYSCSSLTSIEIPASVTSIGYYAFWGCSALSSVIIYAPSLDFYGTNAFDDNASGRKIYVPMASLGTYQTNWSAYAGDIVGFNSCGDNVYYLYNSNTKTLNIFGSGAMKDYPRDPEELPWNSYGGMSTVVIGNGVTHIGNNAFNSCNALTSITFGNSVTSIGDNAFLSCQGLTSVTIPASVTSIGDSAFERCTSLTSITFGNSVTSIGGDAFMNCSSLASIEIPASVTSIGDRAFASCFSLASISVASGNTKYHSEGNCLIETATKTLILGCKTSVIPTGVTSIGNSAFSGCTGLTSITIPANVTSIGDNAFLGCNALASITIPNSVTSIGYWAFNYCRNLTSIEIPASVTSIGDYAFFGCSALTSVTIYAPSLTYYGDYAFDDNASGRKIYVPMASLDTYQTNWSAYAGDIVGLSFSYLDASGNTQYCTDFTVLDNTMNYLAEGWYVVNSDVTYSDDLYTNGDGDVNIILCDGATLTASNITPSGHEDRLRIYGQSQGTGTANISGTLAGYYNLTIYGGTINANILDAEGSVGIIGGTVNVGSISPNGGVSFIGGNVIVTGEVEAGSHSNIFLSGGTVKASSYSASEGYVYISKGLTYYDGEGNSYTGTEEHDAGFLNLTSTEIAAIAGKTLRTFDYRGGTCGDPNVNEGKNVTWLYNMDTHTLTISGTGAMKDYGDGGAPWYSHCADITKVVISNGVTSIGSNAFFECNNTGFTTIAIPASVTNIGDDAFWGCTSLTDVYYYANPTEALLSNWDLDGDDFKAGKATKCHVFDIDDWDDFENPNVTFVGDLAGKNEFSPVLWGYDNGTQTLTISGTGAMADYNSDNQPWKDFRDDITSVVIEDGVTSIGNNAFKDCPSLASVTIYAPELTYYGSNAFDGNADGRKIYVYSDCVDTYKTGWSAYAADIIPIEGIALTANAHDGNYWTTFYCSDTNYKINDEENAWAYTAEYEGGNALTLHKLGKVIPKGTAVIIVGADASIDMTALCNAVAEYSVGNDLHGVDVRTEKSTLGSGTFYVLGKQNDNFGFYQYTAQYMPARKAYLLISGSAAPGLKMVFDDETTSLTPNSPGLSQGEGSDYWYTLSGTRLNAQPTKPGLYINNGRKVVVK